MSSTIHISESQERSRISSETMLRLISQKDKIREKIAKFQASCNHDFEILFSEWKEDDYTCFVSNELDYLHCRICGLEKYAKR